MKKIIPSQVIIPALLLLLASCKKENKDTEPQGVLFQQLLKTVTTTSLSSQVVTVLYNYDAAGRVVRITTTYAGGFGQYTNTEVITRNAMGLPENIEYTSSSSGSTTNISTRNSFDGSGKTTGTIQVITGPQNTRDSAVYIYSGNQLLQRPEYRSISNGPYSLLLNTSFQYTGTGNLDKAIFTWATHPGIDTLVFEYDDRVNPLPFTRADAFYWSELFYDDYKQPHNITRHINPVSDSYTCTYQYSANNKPLYRKKSYTGSSAYDETYYYYD